MKPIDLLKEKGKDKSGLGKDYVDGIEEYKLKRPKKVKDKYDIRKKTMGALNKMLDPRPEKEVWNPTTREVTHVDNVDRDPKFAEDYFAYEEELKRGLAPGLTVRACKWCGSHQVVSWVEHVMLCKECGMTTHHTIPDIERFVRLSGLR